MSHDVDDDDDCLKSKDPVGRMLDFLAQEMNREINTIGSKANDSHISRAVVALKPQKIFLVVHRLDFSVYFRRIEREEYSMLKALHGGKSIAGAIESAFQASSIPICDREGYVRHCFERWGALGWFCQPGARQIWES